MKVKTQLENIALRLNDGVNMDWNDRNQIKHGIFYDYGQKSLRLGDCLDNKYEETYCLSLDFKDVAIREIGEERLLKYFKGE